MMLYKPANGARRTKKFFAWLCVRVEDVQNDRWLEFVTVQQYYDNGWKNIKFIDKENK
jgi:hypothetical protein